MRGTQEGGITLRFCSGQEPAPTLAGGPFCGLAEIAGLRLGQPPGLTRVSKFRQKRLRLEWSLARPS